MGLLKSPAVTPSTSAHSAEAPAPGRDSGCASNTSGIDQASFSALLDALLELKEFHGLESDLGRSSWLAEIIEDFSGAIAHLEPPDERVTPM
ncbi:hypothetical protein HZF02_32970 (plasmid) [Pseudomonas yamanorum]|nr:hypothetical protein HZF02_32970 [Pseudomonas yamanorum]